MKIWLHFTGRAVKKAICSSILKKWLQKDLIFIYFFPTLTVQFFGFGDWFSERAVKNVIYVSKRVFFRDDNFWKGWCQLISEFDREIFIILAKNFWMVLRTAIHVSTGLFWGKNWFNKSLLPTFFSELERETYRNLTDFFPAMCQKCYLCLQRSFSGKRQNLKKNWSVVAINSR